MDGVAPAGENVNHSSARSTSSSVAISPLGQSCRERNGSNEKLSQRRPGIEPGSSVATAGLGEGFGSCVHKSTSVVTHRFHGERVGQKVITPAAPLDMIDALFTYWRDVSLCDGPAALVMSLRVEEDGDEIIAASPRWRDLAPMIHRQRLVVEGTCRAPITDDRIRSYLSRLSVVCGMKPLMEPATHRSDRHGWAGWIHWENSGAHFYAWEEPTLFFSVDIYTCTEFDAAAVVKFTRDSLDAVDVVARAF
jgi:S-adenosylmethionine decarboxylase